MASLSLRSRAAHARSTLIALALLLPACQDQGPDSTPGPSSFVPPVNATVLPGEYVGRRDFEPTAVTFSFRIDSVYADSVAGVWQMRYTLSTATDEGTFTGTFTPGQLSLSLTVIAGCAGRYTANATALQYSGDLWEVRVAPVGSCNDFAIDPLYLMRGDDPGLP